VSFGSVYRQLTIEFTCYLLLARYLGERNQSNASLLPVGLAWRHYVLRRRRHQNGCFPLPDAFAIVDVLRYKRPSFELKLRRNAWAAMQGSAQTPLGDLTALPRLLARLRAQLLKWMEGTLELRVFRKMNQAVLDLLPWWWRSLKYWTNVAADVIFVVYSILCMCDFLYCAMIS